MEKEEFAVCSGDVFAAPLLRTDCELGLQADSPKLANVASATTVDILIRNSLLLLFLGNYKVNKLAGKNYPTSATMDNYTPE
jgi:hypothetical protein